MGCHHLQEWWESGAKRPKSYSSTRLSAKKGLREERRHSYTIPSHRKLAASRLLIQTAALGEKREAAGCLVAGLPFAHFAFQPPLALDAPLQPSGLN